MVRSGAFLLLLIPYLALSLVLSNLALPALAQSPVGDATRFLFEEGKSGEYGIQGHDVGQSQFGQELFTRHAREGNSLGIGSSTLQTTNATSESGVAAIAPFSVTSTQRSAPSPSSNLNMAIQGFGSTSPALSGNTVSPYSGVYSGSGLTSTYSQTSGVGSYNPAGLYQDLNAVPSFSRAASRLSLPVIDIRSDSDYGSVIKKGGSQY
jgi:hypothetical protein